MSLGRAFVMLGLISLIAEARVGIVIQISNVVEESEIIVVGEVTAIDRTGSETIVDSGRTWPMARMLAHVRLVEILKGDAVPKEFRVSFVEGVNDPTGDGPPTATTSLGYQILFLNGGLGSYSFADREFGSVQVMRDCAPAPSKGSAAYAKVVQRVGCTLISSEATAGERAWALRTLQLEGSAETHNLFVAALKTPAALDDSELRPGLIASLVRDNYDPALAMAEQELFYPATKASVRGRSNILLALQNINSGTSVPLLARALKLPQSELRQTAARSMQNMGKSGIYPLLLALDDPDRDVQFYVMQSLSYLNDELFWRPHSTEQDAFWGECIAHWKVVLRETFKQ